MRNVSQSYYGSPAAPLNTTFFAILGPMSPTLPAAAMQAAVAQGTAQGFHVVFVNATAACGPDLTGCRDGCAGELLGARGGRSPAFALNALNAPEKNTRTPPNPTGHPGVASHRNIARTVANAVEAALGWPAPGVL